MVVRFDGFELDLDNQELSRDGKLLSLAPQPSRILALLAANAGRTVSREEIQRHVWGDNHVEADLGLNSCIRKIRAQLGDDPNEPRFIRTVPRRGYRFVASIEPGGHDVPADGGSPGQTRWWVAAALLAIALAVVWWLRPRDRALSPAPIEAAAVVSPAPQGQITLAVLPFANLTADPSQDYVGDGLTEETIARLGQLEPERLAVIARTTAMSFKGRLGDLAEVARELQVGYLVEGSFRRENGTLRATVRLIEGATGLQHGADVYEVPTEDLLSAQATVADRVADWLVERLLPGEPRRAESGLAPELYEIYLLGLHRLQDGTPAGYSDARVRFQKVVEGDPDYAPGWAGLAEAELWTNWFGAEDPAAAVERSRLSAERAIQLDPGLGSPHLLLGYAAFYIHYDPTEAGRRFSRAVELEPGSARAQAWYAAYLSAVAEHRSAIDRAELARRLDPLSMAVRSDLCWLHSYARSFDEALVACDNALQLQPGDAWTTLGKVEALRQLGRNAQAVEALAGLVSALGDGAVVDSWTELASSDAESALEMGLGWLEERARLRPQPYFAASIAAARGSEERALEMLDAAWENRDMLLVFAGVDPRFDPIRSSPAFQELVDRLGLPQAQG